MAFTSIGFQALMILNRLCNERQVHEDGASNCGDRQSNNCEEEKTRADLKVIGAGVGLAQGRKLSREVT